MPSKNELLAKYVKRVAGKGGLEALLPSNLRGGLEAAESLETVATTNAAEAGLKELMLGRDPTPEQLAGLEAIILPKIRPVLDVVDGKFRTDHPLWQKLNDDAGIRGRLEAALLSIGRIELPGTNIPYGGTGFVVGAGLIMTNRHVAGIFASGIGTRQLVFKPQRRAGIDFRRELDRPTGPTLSVTRIVMIHPYWDMALLSVEGMPAQASPLKLSERDVAGNDMVEVAAIGYPAFDTRNDAGVQNDLFRKVFGVKRLQPGTLDGRQQTESFGKMVSAVRHNCSTLGGNSGSALINLETGAVLALHFGGSYLETNYGVPAWELARDGRVVDAGVSFTGSPPGGSPPWASWWGRADNTEAAVDPSPRGSGTPPAQDAQAVSTSKGNAQTMADGSIELTMPLHITVRLGGPSASTEAAATIRAGADGSGTALERMVMPDHDENYSTRRGYDPQFLGVAVPMPEAAHPSVVAKAKDGSSVLPYQNFSIVMHKERRLALLTASNVTADPSLKKPEPGHDYTRKGLSGLGPKDQERWFPDPRLDAAFQLPDVFYTSDEGAFDKGHIVRREDAAWGPTYELLKRANGDTYHVTNCSPQVAGFNRSALGEDNWGDLEDHVLKGAASERYCQFTGPILDPKDDVFVGAGGGRVRIRARIPSRFWKVIVVLGSRQDIAAYAFVLEQDLSAVPLQEEFIVPDNFRRFLEPIVDLELKAGVRFPDIVRRADQHDTTEGAELAMRAGIERRSLTEGVIG